MRPRTSTRVHVRSVSEA